MTKPSDLANEIVKAVKELSYELEAEIADIEDEVTKSAVKKLKQKSPKLTGDYAKGWTRKKQGNRYVIHNKTDYQLTHLLEYGHVKQDGGRTQAIPHIRPVEEETIQAYESKVEEAIRG
jgi:hypothetical protein